MIDLARYDLCNRDDVQRLALDIGAELTRDVLKNLAHALSPEHRVLFFASLLARPYGFISAAIGQDALDEVLRALGELTRHELARRGAPRHVDKQTLN